MVISIDWQTTGTMIASGVAIATTTWQYFGVILGLKKDLTDTAAKLREEMVDNNKEVMNSLAIQGNKITRIETQTELFWNAVGTSVSNLIKQPIHFRKDELMDKLIPANMPSLPESTVEELVELRFILEDELVTLQEVKDPKCLAYSLAIAYINQILYDKGLVKGECK
jgi:hypothetical protein